LVDEFLLIFNDISRYFMIIFFYFIKPEF